MALSRVVSLRGARILSFDPAKVRAQPDHNPSPNPSPNLNSISDSRLVSLEPAKVTANPRVVSFYKGLAGADGGTALRAGTGAGSSQTMSVGQGLGPSQGTCMSMSQGLSQSMNMSQGLSQDAEMSSSQPQLTLEQRERLAANRAAVRPAPAPSTLHTSNAPC